MNNNTYLDEYNQDEQIKQALHSGCLKLTLIFIVILIVSIIIGFVSCGSTNHNKGCEAYGNGKKYNNKR